MVYFCFRNNTIFTFGVACYQLFLQANWTGPLVSKLYVLSCIKYNHLIFRTIVLWEKNICIIYIYINCSLTQSSKITHCRTSKICLFL